MQQNTLKLHSHPRCRAQVRPNKPEANWEDTYLPLATALATEGSFFQYCPALGASALFAVLFGITTLYHVYQGASLRSGFCWVIIMSAIWQTAAFVLRSLSIQDVTVQGYYNAQFILILISPLWTNAFCFLILGRLVTNFTPQGKLGKMRGKWYGWIFVGMDVV